MNFKFYTFWNETIICMQTSFYTTEELKSIGFKSLGKNVLISRKCSIYSPQTISIGSNVRIDDFCILSGNITIGNYCRIAAYCALYGSHGIVMEDYSGMAMKCTVLSASDDYSGDFLIGPIYPDELTNVRGGTVTFKHYSQLGAGCLVFPGVTLNEGAVAGAMTLVNRSLEAWTINTGIPVCKTRPRKKGLLDKIAILNSENKRGGGTDI